MEGQNTVCNVFNMLQCINNSLQTSFTALTELEAAVKLKNSQCNDSNKFKFQENFDNTVNISSVNSENRNAIQNGALHTSSIQDVKTIKSESYNRNELSQSDGKQVPCKLSIVNSYMKNEILSGDKFDDSSVSTKTKIESKTIKCELVNNSSPVHNSKELEEEDIKCKSLSNFEEVITLSSDEELKETSPNESLQEEFNSCPRIRVSKNLVAPITSEISTSVSGNILSVPQSDSVSQEQSEVVEEYHEDFFSKKDVYQIKINFRDSVSISEVETILLNICKLENILDITVRDNKAFVSFADKLIMEEALKMKCGQVGQTNILYVQKVSQPLELTDPETNKRKGSKKQNAKIKRKRLFLAN